MARKNDGYRNGYCVTGAWYTFVSELQCKESYGTGATWSQQINCSGHKSLGSSRGLSRNSRLSFGNVEMFSTVLVLVWHTIKKALC